MGPDPRCAADWGMLSFCLGAADFGCCCWLGSGSASGMHECGHRNRLRQPFRSMTGWPGGRGCELSTTPFFYALHQWHKRYTTSRAGSELRRGHPAPRWPNGLSSGGLALVGWAKLRSTGAGWWALRRCIIGRRGGGFVRPPLEAGWRLDARPCCSSLAGRQTACCSGSGCCPLAWGNVAALRVARCTGGCSTKHRMGWRNTRHPHLEPLRL